MAFAQRVFMRFVADQPVLYMGAPIGDQLRVRIYGWTGYLARAYILDMYGVNVRSLFSDVSITESPQTITTLDGTDATVAHDARGDGHYLVVCEIYKDTTIYEVCAVQCVIPSEVVEIDATEWELKEPVVYYTDQMTGARHNFQAPLKTVRIPSGRRFASSIYDHKPDQQLGRLVMFWHTEKFEIHDSGWVHRAIVTLDYDFTDLDSMALWVASKALQSGIVKDDVMDYITNPNISTERKIQTLLPYATRQMEIDHQGRVINYNFATSASPPRLTMEIYHDVGFLNIDWGKVIGYACVGGAVAGAIAIAIGTAGIGVPLGASIVVGALAGAGIAFATKGKESVPAGAGEAGAVHITVTHALETLERTVADALAVLEEERAKGNVTAEAYERLKASILNIEEEVSVKIKEIEEEAVASINRARWEGGLIGGAVGAFGGGLLGYWIGKGTMEKWIRGAGRRILRR